MKCAQDWDPSAQGLGYWNDGEISGDPRKALYDRRRECYECVFETLLAFDKMLDDEFSGKGARAANGEYACFWSRFWDGMGRADGIS